MTKGWWKVLFFCALACLVSLHLGQDNNYDLKNYHIYNAWAFVTGRWSQDLFAAGPHTYFSPFLDVPYYLAAAALLPSHGASIVALAGIPYGILLYLTYLIAGTVARNLAPGEWESKAFVAACLVLAGPGAATWRGIGTTFNDITIAAIVLAAFHQVLAGATCDEPRVSPRRIATSGLLLGAATGLKLTAAIHVPAMAAAIFALAPDRRARARGIALYAGCVAAAFFLVYGPWGWKLYQLTGNPFFPLLNGVFRSDWMTSVNVRDERFLPRSLPQWLFYPFYWSRLQTSIVSEMPFRDLRLAVAYVFVVGCLGAALASRELRQKLLFGRYRPVYALALFIVVSYFAWLREFSIYRYLVATECLAAVFIVAVVTAVVRARRRRPAWLPSACAISTAALIAGCNVNPDWGRVPVGTDIFSARAPRLEPGSLVIFAAEPMSFLAPALASGSRGLQFMAIPRGFSSGGLGADGLDHELGRRMKAKIAAHAKSLYVVFHRSGVPPYFRLAAFDVEIDTASCHSGRSALQVAFVVCRGKYPMAPPAVPASRE
jgi:hypothetical protein